MSTRNPAILIILLSLPFILWGVCGIGPTFDDYTTLQSPWYIQISNPGYFFPDAVRRPFDFLLGCIVGWWPALFPVLNHLFIIIGHTLSALLIFAICKQLNFSSIATNIASIFFFFSPAILGATLACDGFNQTYAQFWGLLSLWCYLKGKRKLWIACIIMAALSKENGLAWAVVSPVVAYGFGLSIRRDALRHLGIGLLIAVAYFIIYLTITYTGIIPVEYDEQYMDSSFTDHLKDFAQLMLYTWVPVDFMSLVYPPTRNWLLVASTLLLSLPFLLLLAGQWRQFRTLPFLSLVVAFFILASPHLVTLVSIMHNYAALSMAAIIVGFIISNSASYRVKLLFISFALFLAAALFTDVRHYYAARQSGLTGQRLAMQAISAAPQPPRHALCISIDNEDEPRYSNFCVRPVDAFAWGLAVKHYSHYTWKTTISEAILSQYNERQVTAIADSALSHGTDVVWVVGHNADSLTIITKQPTIHE